MATQSLKFKFKYKKRAEHTVDSSIKSLFWKFPKREFLTKNIG